MNSAAQHGNLVGGEWRPAREGHWRDVLNPADRREVVGSVPAMDDRDLSEVYAIAQDAAPMWATTSPIARGRILLRAAEGLRRESEEIARTLTLEMGKTLSEARAEVFKAADFFEYYAGLGRMAQGEVLVHENPGIRAWTIREPVGVVLAITPWNDPLLTPARKLAPALLAGNSVILKPASYTPLVAQRLARVLSDAGLPSGVLATVTGSGGSIGTALLANNGLRAVSFTGSNEVGDELRRDLAARNVKLLAELGGKNAAVVLADADLDVAAPIIATAAFAQAGQRCTATSRVIVEDSVASQLIERLQVAAEALVVGPGTDQTTTMGPVVAQDQKDAVLGFVERARAAGAAVITGGQALEGKKHRFGCFLEPTVLAGVHPEMEVWREEIFGPVITVLTVPDLRSAIDAVNRSRYGLAAAIFTSALASAEQFIASVEVGQVAVNLPTSGWDVHMPFGGYKASGSGHKEQGVDGLRFYTRTKTVAQAP